jgi:hypothetical protein
MSPSRHHLTHHQTGQPTSRATFHPIHPAAWLDHSLPCLALRCVSVSQAAGGAPVVFGSRAPTLAICETVPTCPPSPQRRTRCAWDETKLALLGGQSVYSPFISDSCRVSRIEHRLANKNCQSWVSARSPHQPHAVSAAHTLGDQARGTSDTMAI